MYDFLIVGAGLYGCVFAYEAKKRGAKCLVIEKKDHIGGNCFTKKINGINVHWYGAHIFHTKNVEVWNYMQQFCSFNNYINSPIANYNGELYNLPFNMNTFCKMWPDVRTPEEAKRRISEQCSFYSNIENPRNLEEQALKLGGRDIYEKLIKGYSEKQWGMSASEIPAFVLRRLPFRFTFDNNYFNDPYQGIPIGGYTGIFERMLTDIDVRLNEDFFKSKTKYMSMVDRVVYTGPLDAFYDFCFGPLEYRTVRFKHKLLKGVENYQGNAVFNFTDKETPYTRIIEHKHFEFKDCPDTVISYEYSETWRPGMEPYYPINNVFNEELLQKYNSLAIEEKKISFGGRLAEYRYYDMDKVVEKALQNPMLR